MMKIFDEGNTSILAWKNLANKVLMKLWVCVTLVSYSYWKYLVEKNLINKKIATQVCLIHYPTTIFGSDLTVIHMYVVVIVHDGSHDIIQKSTSQLSKAVTRGSIY